MLIAITTAATCGIISAWILARIFPMLAAAKRGHITLGKRLVITAFCTAAMLFFGSGSLLITSEKNIKFYGIVSICAFLVSLGCFALPFLLKKIAMKRFQASNPFTFMEAAKQVLTHK